MGVGGRNISKLNTAAPEVCLFHCGLCVVPTGADKSRQTITIPGVILLAGGARLASLRTSPHSAGQADALYVHETTNKLALLDWKRTKAIRADGFWRSLREPLQDLPDTNFWIYALQLNVPVDSEPLRRYCAETLREAGAP